MADLIITENNTTRVNIGTAVFKDELVTFTAAGTYAAGTILARDTGTEKMIAFVKGGSTAGNGVPSMVLTQPVTATAAGNVPARPMISGQVRTSQLIIEADGDASNVDATVLDQLRVYGIEGLTTVQNAQTDKAGGGKTQSWYSETSGMIDTEYGLIETNEELIQWL